MSLHEKWRSARYAPPGGTKDMALKGADFMQFFRRSDVHFSWFRFSKDFRGKKLRKSVLVFLFLVGSPNFEGAGFFLGDVIYISIRSFHQHIFFVGNRERNFWLVSYISVSFAFLGGGLKPMVVLHPKWWFVKGGLLFNYDHFEYPC